MMPKDQALLARAKVLAKERNPAMSTHIAADVRPGRRNEANNATRIATPFSFDGMIADLQALYSGSEAPINIDDLTADLVALYSKADVTIMVSDLIADVRALYGNGPVYLADLIMDLRALYAAQRLQAV